ncbi:MAG: sensor histidine kinase, partial [Halobacteriaceae archaeon]
IEDILTLAREGKRVQEIGTVDFEDVIDSCWRNVETKDATLEVKTNATIKADEDRLPHILENLFSNAIRHGGDDVTITIGTLSDGTGFYVADNGPGIPEDQRDDIFEYGYSTSEEGTGFGLAIVKEIVEAHGWNLTVTESDDGGARFEIRNVEFE